MADTVTLADAFGSCSDEIKKCECTHEAKGAKEVISCEDSKKADQKCAKNGCFCQLFRRRKGDKHKDDKWELILPKQNQTTGEEPFETDKSEKYVYECYCVKPKLPSGYTLCACDSCKLSFGKGAKNDLISCEGSCFGDGKCHLFRIKRPAKDSDGKEEWEHVAGPDSMNGMDKAYYYRCFCVKLG